MEWKNKENYSVPTATPRCGSRQGYIKIEEKETHLHECIECIEWINEFSFKKYSSRANIL